MSESDTNRDIDETSQDSAEEVPPREPPKPLKPALVIDRRPRFSDNRPARSGWTTAVACLCGVVALGLLLNFILEFRREAVLDAIEDDVVMESRLANERAEQDALEQAEQARSEALSASEFRFQRVRRKLDAMQDLIAEIGESEQRLASLRGELFGDEIGPRVASDETMLRRVILLTEQIEDSAGPSADEIAQDFESVAAPFRKAESVPADYVPSEDFTQILNELDEDIASRRGFLRDAANSLTAIIEDAKSRVPVATSLSDAIVSRRDADAKAILDAERRRIEAEERRIAKAKTDQEIADMQAVAAAEAELQKTKTAEMLQQREKERLDREARARKAALEADFQRDLQTIKTHLASLLADGSKLRGGDRSIDPGPVSLAHLKSTGATEPTKDGLRAFVSALNPYVNDRSDRKAYQWANMLSHADPDKWYHIADDTFAKQGHRLLIKYADLLMEKGMLAP